MALSVQARQAIITDGFAFKVGVAAGNDFSSKLGRALLITDGYLYRALSTGISFVTALWDRRNFINV